MLGAMSGGLRPMTVPSHKSGAGRVHYRIAEGAVVHGLTAEPRSFGPGLKKVYWVEPVEVWVAETVEHSYCN